MKTFRELLINLKDFSVEELINLIESCCLSPWVRVPSKEDSIGTKDKIFCFERSGDVDLPGAALFIAKKEKSVWYVPNIVPTEHGELGYDKYNQILMEFNDCVIQPAIKNTRIEVNVTEDSIFIGDVAGQEVEDALIKFSNLANKSTGSSHPMDRERWFRFLVLANRAEEKVSSDLIIRTLVEQGWSEERANDLGIEFELAQELLDYARSH